MLNYGYELIDPRDNLPFYVGITNNPKLRFQQHLMIDPSNYYKTDRIQNILDDDLKPIMKIIFEEEDITVARQMEKDKINKYLNDDVYLTNLDHAQPRERGMVRKPSRRTGRNRSTTTAKREIKQPLPEGYITAKEAIAILGIDAKLFNSIKSVFIVYKAPEGWYSRDKVEDYNASIMVNNPSPTLKKAFFMHLKQALKGKQDT